MKEFLPENEHPLNQMSKQLLEQLQQSPDDEALYALQLVSHSLPKPMAELRDSQQEEIRSMVDQLMIEEPEQAMKYLLETAGGQPVEYNLDKINLSKNPEDLTLQLLNGLKVRMGAERRV